MKYIIRAVESRREYVEEILKELPEAEVYWDTSGNAMNSYLAACKLAGDEPVVLLEDDIILTKNFKSKIEAVISQYPEILINFFSLSKKKTTPHFKKGREYCMNQCEYFPAGFAKKVLAAYESWTQKEKHPTAYDYLVGYAWGSSKPYLVWCPSLVQHRVCKSLIDSRRSSKRQSVTFKEE